MSTPKQTEAQRAADRGQDQIFAGSLGFDKVGLTTPSVVQGLLGEFVKQVSALDLKHTEGAITEAELKDGITTIAGHYGDIFMGRVAEYGSTPWNSPDSLGKWLVEDCGLLSTREDAAKNALIALGVDMLKTVIWPFNADQIAEDVAQFRAEALLEDHLSLMLGYGPEEM